MNREEVIKLAREQGLPETETEGVFIVNTDDLGRMLAAEREACAKAIRARGDEYGTQVPWGSDQQAFVEYIADRAAQWALEEALRSILGWRELRSGAGEIPIVRIEEIAREALSATAREG